MKRTELMVGNLFHPINRHQEIHLPMTMITYQVVQIRTFTVMYIPEGSIEACQEPKEMNMFDMSPIPLTEEWLLKFKDQLDLEFDNQDGDYVFIRGAGCDINELDRERVKYVHRLQNLFFALKGELLTIKQLTN